MLPVLKLSFVIKSPHITHIGRSPIVAHRWWQRIASHTKASNLLAAAWNGFASGCVTGLALAWGGGVPSAVPPPLQLPLQLMLPVL